MQAPLKTQFPKSLAQKSPALRAIHLLRELYLFILSLYPTRRVRRLKRSKSSDLRVVVIPGLMASDRSMRPMRLALRAAGFRTYRWCLGRNTGATPALLDQFDARVRRIQHADPRPVILVGWSLGGLIAREYAKHAPERVAAVVTLGSPFSGDISAMVVARLYEWVAGHAISALPIACALSEKPPVPTAAIWSHNDGVVAPLCARGQAPEADCQIEVSCAHLAYPWDAGALSAVIEAIERCRTVAEQSITAPAVGQTHRLAVDPQRQAQAA